MFFFWPGLFGLGEPTSATVSALRRVAYYPQQRSGPCYPASLRPAAMIERYTLWANLFCDARVGRSALDAANNALDQLKREQPDRYADLLRDRQRDGQR